MKSVIPSIVGLFVLFLFSPTQTTAQIFDEVASKIQFRNIGPAFMTGRIADIAIDPKNNSTWYVATASGNVWKTTTRGAIWEPIFDQYGSYSTGCLAIDPMHSNVVWLGTGENQSQRSVGWGDGVYKTTDAGKSWTNMGLKTSEHIGDIIIHPDDGNTVLVASQGPLWKEGGERGVFKTMDGGENWKNTLQISENTGVTDLAFHPSEPNIIYATSYQRRRHVGILVAGGPESRIYKSTDGGDTWKKLSSGLPGGDVGRIAVAVSPQKPNVVYALFALPERKGGFYRSEDYGESWTKMNDYAIVDPQYYGEIYADPNQFDKVYSMDMMIHYTEDGGKTFQRLNSRNKHVDNHALVFDINNPDYLMIGCDGGIYESWDKGDHWTFHDNLPIVQFYRVGLDNEKPFYNVYGGTQDNSTLGGPSRTISRHGITNEDWTLVLGGDGFQTRVDPSDPNILYAQSQYAGIVRYDKRTGQRTELQPQPANDDTPIRWHWDAPLLISQHNSNTLYFAAQNVFKSENRGDSWVSISGDLSRGEDRNQRQVMGKVWPPESVWKNVFTSPHGTIVAMAESPIKNGLLICGTDDGLIQITEDDGANWKKANVLPGAPPKGYIADVFCSGHNIDVIYAVVNNHKEGDFKPYVFKSDDLGKTWKNISAGVQQHHAAWCIMEDHISPNLLFLATEYAMYTSQNNGTDWKQMKGGLPTMSFRDMEIQQEADDLVLASFGRGFYILDDLNALRHSMDAPAGGSSLFPVDDALLFSPMGNKGYSEKGVFGDGYYTAPNPEFGASLHVYLQDKMETKKEARLSGNIKHTSNYPDMDILREEDMETPGEYYISISTAQGDIIQKIKLKNKKGYQNAHWNLSMQIYDDKGEDHKTIGYVSPGTYLARLHQFKNDEHASIGEVQNIRVDLLDISTEQPDANRITFYSKIAQTLMQAEKMEAQLEKIKGQIERAFDRLQMSTNPQSAFETLEQDRLLVHKLINQLNGDQTLIKHSEYYLPGIIDRLNNIFYNHRSSFQITETQKDNYGEALKGLDAITSDFNSLKGKYLSNE